MREFKTKRSFVRCLGWSGVITLAGCDYFEDWPQLPGGSGIIDDDGEASSGEDSGAEGTFGATASAEAGDTSDSTSAASSTGVETGVSETASSGEVVEPTVHKFKLVRGGSPDEPTIELHWSVTGVSGVVVPTVDNTVRPPTGSVVVAQYPQDIYYQDSVVHPHVLLDAEDGTELVWEYLVRPCFFDWILPPHIFESEGPAAPENCPTAGIISPGAGQEFERGFMLEVEDTNTVYWGTYDNLSVANGVDAENQGVLWNYGDDYTTDPSFPGGPPPSGLLQPSGRLGEVWRLRSNTDPRPVGNSLGWAVDPPVAYEVRIQSAYRGGMWITRADGGWLYFDRSMPYWNEIVLGDGTIISP